MAGSTGPRGWGNWANPIQGRIPARPPGASWLLNKKDQASWPPYEVLDEFVSPFRENDQTPDEIVAAGMPADAVAQVTRLIRLNEYKRRQSPVGISVNHRRFGKDWRFPITNKFVG